jgi:hypothetical protein
VSGANACRCRPRRVFVLQRYCNHSAFNGYRRTPSDYSTVVCVNCGQIWRTKANYVASMPDAPEKWPVMGRAEVLAAYEAVRPTTKGATS